MIPQELLCEVRLKEVAHPLFFNLIVTLEKTLAVFGFMEACGIFRLVVNKTVVQKSLKGADVLPHMLIVDFL